MMTITEYTMSNVDHPPPQPPPYSAPVYLPPQSTVQLAHATSDAVISGLAKSPYLLGVVVIVLVGVGAAIYFLQILITGQATHLKSLLTVQQEQMDKIIEMHKREFDALLEMGNRLSATPQGPGPQGPAPVNPPQPRGPR
jgi:hypothetical protein